MAKWKFKIYQKFVRELQQREQLLKIDPVETSAATLPHNLMLNHQQLMQQPNSAIQPYLLPSNNEMILQPKTSLPPPPLNLTQHQRMLSGG